MVSSPIKQQQALLQSLESSYNDAAQQGDLTRAARNHPDITSIDFNSNLESIYNNRLGKPEGAARAFWGAILNSSPRNRCPSCLHRAAVEVDHVLPRSSFAFHAFQPSNLVPICDICNGAKAARFPKSPGESPLHPYFDMKDDQDYKWLSAKVSQQSYAPVTFEIIPPASWSMMKTIRVMIHVRRFRVFELFTSQASDLLSSYDEKLQLELLRSGAGGVQQFLLEMASSFERSGLEPYSWITCRAWARSIWFCSGGWIEHSIMGPIPKPTTAVALFDRLD